MGQNRMISGGALPLLHLRPVTGACAPETAVGFGCFGGHGLSFFPQRVKAGRPWTCGHAGFPVFPDGQSFSSGKMVFDFPQQGPTVFVNDAEMGEMADDVFKIGLAGAQKPSALRDEPDLIGAGETGSYGL